MIVFEIIRHIYSHSFEMVSETKKNADSAVFQMQIKLFS